ncbi:hypothetical protein RFI_08429, partial [Reticulomyxa filosa]
MGWSGEENSYMRVVRKLFAELAHTVSTLHKRGYLHLDIALQNVLIATQDKDTAEIGLAFQGSDIARNGSLDFAYSQMDRRDEISKIENIDNSLQQQLTIKLCDFGRTERFPLARKVSPSSNSTLDTTDSMFDFRYHRMMGRKQYMSPESYRCYLLREDQSVAFAKHCDDVTSQESKLKKKSRKKDCDGNVVSNSLSARAVFTPPVISSNHSTKDQVIVTGSATPNNLSGSTSNALFRNGGVVAANSGLAAALSIEEKKLLFEDLQPLFKRWNRKAQKEEHKKEKLKQKEKEKEKEKGVTPNSENNKNEEKNKEEKQTTAHEETMSVASSTPSVKENITVPISPTSCNNVDSVTYQFYDAQAAE